MKKFLTLISLLLVLAASLTLFGCDNTPADTTAQPGTSAPKGTTAETPETNANEDSTAAKDTDSTGEDTTAPADDGTTAAKETEAPTDVVNIGTAEELIKFAEGVTSGEEYYEYQTINITADIDLSGKNWVPIDGTNLLECTIEGNGHVINGMTVVRALPDSEYDEETGEALDAATAYGFGFIGKMPNEITIQNITFNNAKITANSKHAGCVIGDLTTTAYFDNVTVSNLTIDGGVGKQGDLAGICIRVGGLIGCAAFGGNPEITNCTVTNSRLTGFHNIGGLVGCVVLDAYTFENNKVEKVDLYFSAGFSDTYDAGVARYFADPFYNISGEWEVYHGEEDAAAGNTFKEIVSHDMAYEKEYKDAEGKTADYDGEFPV